MIELNTKKNGTYDTGGAECFLCAKFHQNEKNKNKKRIFCGNISFVFGKESTHKVTLSSPCLPVCFHPLYPLSLVSTK
jgi:hypothetical protein